MSKTQRIALMGLLIALHVILGNLIALKLWNLKLNIVVATYLVAGFLFGPAYAAVIGALGDLVGALVFPVGVYFFPFTITAAISGYIFGSLGRDMFKDIKTRTRDDRSDITYIVIIGRVMLNEIVITLVLNTLFISQLYGVKLASLISVRALQALIDCVIYPVLILVLFEALESLYRSRH